MFSNNHVFNRKISLSLVLHC